LASLAAGRAAAYGSGPVMIFVRVSELIIATLPQAELWSANAGASRVVGRAMDPYLGSSPGG